MNLAASKNSQDALKWPGSEHKEWLLFLDNADDPHIM
jgi:hypothetical protein